MVDCVQSSQLLKQHLLSLLFGTPNADDSKDYSNGKMIQSISEQRHHVVVASDERMLYITNCAHEFLISFPRRDRDGSGRKLKLTGINGRRPRPLKFGLTHFIYMRVSLNIFFFFLLSSDFFSLFVCPHSAMETYMNVRDSG